MERRTYGQFCALAKTLDMIGERWTVLVVRELALGLKRYSDLAAGLPGIGTSILARRLQYLETDGVIRRSTMPPPAASTVYELTAAGRELAEALLPLALWGARHALGKRNDNDVFRAEWPLLAVGAFADPASASASDHDDVYEFRIDESVAHVSIDHGLVTVTPGPARQADVTVTMGSDLLAELALGTTDLVGAAGDGRLCLEGQTDALARLARIMQSVVGRR